MVSGSSNEYFDLACGCRFLVVIFNSDELANHHGWDKCPKHDAVDDLIAALEKYGNHTKTCPASLQPFNETPCECGWREAYPEIDQRRATAAQDAIRKAKPKP